MATEESLRQIQNKNATSTIRRKPLPSEGRPETSVTRHLQDLSLTTAVDEQDYFATSPTATFSAVSGDEYLDSEPAVEAVTVDNVPNKPSKIKTAFEDVRHFAGGLISHPYESTKHFSILRHSHGLVYFKGFSTNIAITVFADRELPDDRQFWLQKKGFSGNTGLKIGAMVGTKSAWINVTPTVTATADQLPPSDERAWRRDIDKFLRKAPKELRSHSPRETDVLRIPCEAQDGYFRVLLCTGEKGKKVLCPSPVFRLASTSTSSSSIRGASLSTLPVELGVKIGQLAARTVAVNTVAPLASTVTGQVKQMLPVQPALLQTAASTAYDASSVSDRVKQSNQQYQASRKIQYEQLISGHPDELALSEVVGDDDGPSPPFPFRFASNIIEGTGRSRAVLGMPTANLPDLPEDIRLRLSGTYMGWASLAPSKSLEVPPDFLSCWYQALITIAPLPENKASVVLQKDARVYMIQDFGSYSFSGAKLSVIVMAPLRPHDSTVLGELPDVESQLFAITQDIAITQASLARPAWSADNTLTRIKTDKSNRSLTERYVDARSVGQKQVDRVPLHKAGIRTNSMGLRDQLVGNGGVCVKR